jgi:hypothetical protein
MGCVKRRVDRIFGFLFGLSIYGLCGSCGDTKRSAEPFPPNASAASGGGLGAAPPSAWFVSIAAFGFSLSLRPLFFSGRGEVGSRPSTGNLLSAG